MEVQRMGKLGVEWGGRLGERAARSHRMSVWMVQFTVREMVAECCSEPEVAVMVIVDVMG